MKLLIYKYRLAPMLFFWMAILSGPINANETGLTAMDEIPVCQLTPLEKSQNVIRFILDDLTDSYTHVGGGGISGIKQVATYTYVISISQEERIDQISYELEVGQNCETTILSRKVSAISAGEH